jgi:hypothetical protein
MDELTNLTLNILNYIKVNKIKIEKGNDYEFKINFRFCKNGSFMFYQQKVSKEI